MHVQSSIFRLSEIRYLRGCRAGMFTRVEGDLRVVSKSQHEGSCCPDYHCCDLRCLRHHVSLAVQPDRHQSVSVLMSRLGETILHTLTTGLAALMKEVVQIRCIKTRLDTAPSIPSPPTTTELTPCRTRHAVIATRMGENMSNVHEPIK